MNQHYLGALMVLASAAGFATLPIFIKLAYGAGANLLTILATRFVLASVCLWAILHVRGIDYRVSTRTLIRLCLLGAVGYGAMSTSFAASLQHLPASLASMLLYLYPAIVTVLALLLGLDRLTWRKAGALLVCFSGLFFILGVSFEGVSMAGFFWGLGAAATYSLYILAGNVLLKDTPPLVVTTYVCTAAAVLFSSIAATTDGFIVHLPVFGWLTLLGIAIFSTIVGILGFFSGMTHVGPANASIISIAEPVITVAISIVLLGETITLFQVSGGLLILAGILLLQWPSQEKGPTSSVGPS